MQFRNPAWKTLDELIWSNVSLRLGETYFEEKNYQLLEKLLSELKISCKKKELQSQEVMTLECYDESKTV